MTNDVIVRGKEGTLTFVPPFMHIPTKDHLIQSMREALKKVDAFIEVDIMFAEMNPEGCAALMKMTSEFWRG